MNERIKELAEQAGFMEAWFSESGDDCEREIKKFAALIRADEREACVKFLERIDLGNLPPNMELHYGLLIDSLISGIRARGNT